MEKITFISKEVMIQMSEDHTCGYSDVQFTAALERSSNGELCWKLWFRISSGRNKIWGNLKIEIKINGQEFIVIPQFFL